MTGLVRFLVAIVVATTLALVTIDAQVPGRNVNMVSGGSFPGGDPFLQKQNEPSLAVSTRNPCHLLAGANDYRAVNLPGLPEDKEIGDSWVGWYESTDCGATWYSTLMPGYLQDNSAEGNASPVKGLSTGADPVVRSGAAGTFYYLFIAFNRGSNVGKLALARAIDHNDREAFIDPDKITDVGVRRQRSPIKYIDTKEVARGSAGLFIDKPFLAVYPGTGTCTMDGETVPATNVYVSWTEFIGNSDISTRTKVHFARSTDCGATWQPVTKLTEGYPYNQGSVIGVGGPNGQNIYVVWRQIRSDRTADAMLYARSIDGGRTFTKAEYVPGLEEGNYKPFDMNTTSTLLGDPTITFRTVGYGTVAFTDEGPNGTLYLALTQPQTPNTNGGLGGINSRIMLMRTDGTSWSNLVEAVPFNGNTHQIMPVLTYAAGRLQLTWYDLRFDESGLTDTRLIDEKQALSVSPKIRHTLDVLGAQAVVPLAWPPPAGFFQEYGVAQPDYNDVDSNGVAVPRGPRISQYVIGDPNPNVDEGTGPRQVQFNFPNLFLYGGGSISFMGDYIDNAATPFVLENGVWVRNGMAYRDNLALATLHAAWTDNRDAGVPTGETDTDLLGYTPPSVLPPNVTLRDTPPCSPDTTRSRDANVYTSRISQDFSLTLPVNNKRTNNAGVVRAFAVNLANGTETLSTFTLSITDPNASLSRQTFLGSYPVCQDPSAPNSPLPPPVHSISVKVLPKSSITRTVYLNCGATAARRVVVTATRSDNASASVAINADPSSPASKNANGDDLGPESHNPDAENPDAENPDAENPDAENPDAENPDAENPDAENPDAENPDAENPDAENPDAENPDAENPDAENANYQDVSVDITNDGDTTSGYQVTTQTTGDTSGYAFLLLANRVYATPTSIDCYLVRRRTNQQLFAIPAPDLTGAFFDENSDSEKNATLLVRPGESVRVILRVVWDGATTQPFCNADDPSAANYCFNKVIFRTRAQAPNTGEIRPREDSLGGADLTAAGTINPSPVTVGFGGFFDVPKAEIQNIGESAAATDFSWQYFLSSDPVVDARDIPTGNTGGVGGLAPGSSITFGPQRINIAVPTDDVNVPVGTQYVGLLVDQNSQIVESNESNNVLLATTPVNVMFYGATINDGPVYWGFPFDRTVSVTGPSGPLHSATVTLSLECNPCSREAPPMGPSGTTPGMPSTFTSTTPLFGTTDEFGQITFRGLEVAQGLGYRIIMTIGVPGVGTFKFQSAPFDTLTMPGDE